MYSDEDREWALYVVEECGGNINKAADIVAGPSRETIRRWAREDRCIYRPQRKIRVFLSYEEKLTAVRALMSGEKAGLIAQRYGVTAPSIYNWRRQLLERGEISFMTQDDIAASCTPTPVPDEIEELKRRCEELELENAILEQTIEILKKT